MATVFCGEKQGKCWELGFWVGENRGNIENRAFAWWKMMENRGNFWKPGFRVEEVWDFLGTGVLWLGLVRVRLGLVKFG